MNDVIKSSSDSVYTLETADEKKMRMGITVAMVAVFLLVGYFLLPLITQTIRNWIDFGIQVGKLFIMIGIVGTIFLMRNVLIARWKSAIRKMTRFLIKTDLPGLLEVVVQNRRDTLAKFNTSIKKMMAAISLHTTKMAERAKSPCKKTWIMPHSLKNRPRTQMQISTCAIKPKTRLHILAVKQQRMKNY